MIAIFLYHEDLIESNGKEEEKEHGICLRYMAERYLLY